MPALKLRNIKYTAFAFSELTNIPDISRFAQSCHVRQRRHESEQRVISRICLSHCSIMGADSGSHPFLWLLQTPVPAPCKVWSIAEDELNWAGMHI